MALCVIGSHAMRQAGLFVEEPRDLDLIADFDSAVSYMNKNQYKAYPINEGKILVGKKGREICEISIAWPNTTNAEFLEYLNGRIIPTLDELYTLKMSHRFLKDSPHFYKTMRHIKRMRAKGAKVPIALEAWLRRREKETYNYKLPNLNQGKNTFFSGDGVTYTYDHDSLHKAVAHYYEPLYTEYQKDGSEVLCDKNKWEAMTHWNKLMAVAEECAVLALERSLIPFPGVKTPYEAFKLALMKVCTSITSGWFREFAWEHHDEILKIGRDYNYVAMFEQGLKNGVVIKNESY